ncbi:MAP3K12-binding inhibitory protein 1 isoform X4 [Xenopus laevis]|uniref:MAP3K12-binding inhibitory protein 1 isoform X4 n=1 Tax=Xenopus laevis TaxID=8355 RepID=A0A8J0TD80_XENLA|nr:MAP3K12-binding inhibitory protein 1 isoform X4 [Xenopus laevis]
MDFLETQQPEKVGEEGVISHSYEEAVRGILLALQRCTQQLKVTENSVRFDINWDSLQCLPDAKPALLCSLLQQHVAHIQPFIDKLQALVKEDVHRNDSSAKTQNVAEKGDHELMDIEADGKITPESSSDEFLRTSDCFDPSVVQIKAKKSEIDRRILAFIERKQAEINENNVREFCNVIDCNQENSCARTDAVFTPYPGFKSHIKGGPVPKDVYQRIKRLEDRILELEGISPEYFNSVDISKKRKAPQTSENYSLAEIDQKIKTLKQSLLQKSSRFNAEAMQT